MGASPDQSRGAAVPAAGCWALAEIVAAAPSAAVRKFLRSHFIATQIISTGRAFLTTAEESPPVRSSISTVPIPRIECRHGRATTSVSLLLSAVTDPISSVTDCHLTPLPAGLPGLRVSVKLDP